MNFKLETHIHRMKDTLLYKKLYNFLLKYKFGSSTIINLCV